MLFYTHLLSTFIKVSKFTQITTDDTRSVFDPNVHSNCLIQGKTYFECVITSMSNTSFYSILSSSYYTILLRSSLWIVEVQVYSDESPSLHIRLLLPTYSQQVQFPLSSFFMSVTLVTCASGVPLCLFPCYFLAFAPLADYTSHLNPPSHTPSIYIPWFPFSLFPFYTSRFDFRRGPPQYFDSIPKRQYRSHYLFSQFLTAPCVKLIPTLTSIPLLNPPTTQFLLPLSPLMSHYLPKICEILLFVFTESLNHLHLSLSPHIWRLYLLHVIIKELGFLFYT